jgi:hypothetical protein
MTGRELAHDSTLMGGQGVVCVSTEVMNSEGIHRKQNSNHDVTYYC